MLQLLILAIACTSQSAAEPPAHNLLSALRPVAQFAISLYRNVLQTNSNASSNVLINPLQVATGLLLACSASQGPTQNEIMSVLNLVNGPSCQVAFQEVKAMYRDGPHRTQSLDELEKQFDDVYYSVNRPFCDNSIDIKPEFSAALTEQFNTTVGQVDFKGNADGARKEISQWISDQTAGKLPDFFPAGGLTAAIRIMLANTDFLQFIWANQFDNGKTTKGTFTNADGTQSQVDFMQTTASFRYKAFAANEIPGYPAFQVVNLPNMWLTISLTIFLPNDVKGLPELEKALTVDGVNQTANAVPKQKKLLKLTVPKVATDNTIDLVASLKTLGVKKLFENDADLSPMTDTKGAGFDGFAHRSTVDMSERGVKIATGSTLGRKSGISIGSPVDLRVDHPFLYIIRLETTRFPMHIGRINKL